MEPISEVGPEIDPEVGAVPSITHENEVPDPEVPEVSAAVPVKKPRGRPKGAANKPKPVPTRPTPTLKAAPDLRSRRIQKQAPPVQECSSDSDDNTYQTLVKDDIETSVLQFLHARKLDQQRKRHALWSGLASQGLR